jgi:hypothetical protein
MMTSGAVDRQDHTDALEEGDFHKIVERSEKLNCKDEMSENKYSNG